MASVDVAELVTGVRAADRSALGRAITLVESTRPDHRQAADELLDRLLPGPGDTVRMAVTGVPGVGKSTFVEALGSLLTGRGKRVAVLAVDPSSSRTGGSILGDKTRMPDLSNHASAYVRPSPTSGTLGGVTRSTRESIAVVEAAGFDTVVVETVGVGQSEAQVRDMVDFFALLLLPGAGDELQGIKKGVLELADLVAVNKADGPGVAAAEATAGDYRRALHLTEPLHPEWTPPVLTCSAATGDGIAEIWAEVERHREILGGAGILDTVRERQRLDWMRTLLEHRLVEDLRADDAVARRQEELEADVARGTTSPARAVSELLALHRASAT